MKVREIPSARGSRTNINNFSFFLEDCRTIFSPELHQNDSPTCPADEILRSVDLVNRRYSVPGFPTGFFSGGALFFKSAPPRGGTF